MSGNRLRLFGALLGAAFSTNAVGRLRTTPEPMPMTSVLDKPGVAPWGGAPSKWRRRATPGAFGKARLSRVKK